MIVALARKILHCDGSHRAEAKSGKIGTVSEKSEGAVIINCMYDRHS
jgi:hypothetical protein